MSTPPVAFQSLKIALMWLFLLPLIIILGTIDVLTEGRSRKWPFLSDLRTSRQ